MNASKLKYIIPLTCILFCTSVTVESKLFLQLTTVCGNDSDLYKGIVNASIRTVDKRNLLTVNFTIPENLNDKLMIVISVFRLVNNKYVPFLKNLTANICSVFRKPNLPALVMPFYQEYLRHTDLPPRCPILQDTYHLTDYYVRGDMLPSFMPRINFKFNLHFYQIRLKKNLQLAFLSVTAKIFNVKN